MICVERKDLRKMFEFQMEIEHTTIRTLVNLVPRARTFQVSGGNAASGNEIVH